MAEVDERDDRQLWSDLRVSDIERFQMGSNLNES